MKSILRIILGLVILGGLVAAGIILAGRQSSPPPLLSDLNKTALKKTQALVDRAAVDKVIAPLSQNLQDKFKEHYPEAWQWLEKFRALYAALPKGAHEQLAKTGEYSFKIEDLPKPQADMMREWLQQDTKTRQDIEKHTGKPLDPSKVKFSFVINGGLVQLRYGAEGFSAGWGPIGQAPKDQTAPPIISEN